MNWTQTLKMLLLTLLVCFSLSALGQLEEFGDDIDSDLADFNLDIVRPLKDGGFCTFWCLDFLFWLFFFCTQAPRRVPRQVKTILTKVRFTTETRRYLIIYVLLCLKFRGQGFKSKCTNIADIIFMESKLKNRNFKYLGLWGDNLAHRIPYNLELIIEFWS